MMRRALRKIRKSIWLLTAPIWLIAIMFIRKWRKLWSGRYKKEDKIFIKIGHRGAAGYEPENTLASFKRALELGVDAVELDVHCCSTGEVVAMHDKTLERTTNGKGYVIEKSLAELKSLNAGKGQQIPTLEEVLNLIDKKTIVNIELKGAHTAESVAKIVRYYINNYGWKPEMFWISSFDHEQLKKFRSLEPEIKIGALVTRIPRRRYADFIETLEVDFINPSMNFINKKFIDQAHKKGLKIFAYTVNHPEDIIRMKLLGVDGIFSNFPDRL